VDDERRPDPTAELLTEFVRHVSEQVDVPAFSGDRRAVGRRPRRAPVVRRATAITVVTAVVVSALALAVAYGPRSAPKGPGPAPSGRTGDRPSVTVDRAATPRGWVPVDYGAAQISVPADWVVVVGGCPDSPDGTVMLGLSHDNCPLFGSNWPVVRITPLSRSPASTPTRLNGIRAYLYPYRGPGQVSMYQVPSLGVEVTASGPLAARITATLTHSPRAVALAPGPIPPAPRSWHRLAFGGVSMAVPRSWPVERSGGWDECVAQLQGLPGPHGQVQLTQGATSIVPGGCLSQVNVAPAGRSSSAEGLVVDPGPYGPLPAAGFGRCLAIRTLRVCPASSARFDVLLLAVHVPGVHRPVAVEIGLSGSGVTARTVLFSLSRS
jgi:hypothetical protein